MAEAIDPRMQEIERSLANLEVKVREHTQRAQSRSRVTLIVGIIFILFVLSYLFVLASKLRKELEPETLAATVASLAGRQIPEIEKALKAHAPEYVQSLREELVQQIPSLRTKLEDWSLAMVDKFGGRLDSKVDEIVEAMIQKYKPEIQPLIESAVKPGNAAELEKTFKNSLEELIGPQVDELITNLDTYVAATEHHLDRLSMPDDKLGSDERLIKTLITSIMVAVDQTASGMGVEDGGASEQTK